MDTKDFLSNCPKSFPNHGELDPSNVLLAPGFSEVSPSVALPISPSLPSLSRRNYTITPLRVYGRPSHLEKHCGPRAPTDLRDMDRPRTTSGPFVTRESLPGTGGVYRGVWEPCAHLPLPHALGAPNPPPTFSLLVLRPLPASLMSPGLPPLTRRPTHLILDPAWKHRNALIGKKEVLTVEPLTGSSGRLSSIRQEP